MKAWAFIVFLGLVSAGCGYSPPPCDEKNCNGCCDASNSCESGTTTYTCGSGGKKCVSCSDGNINQRCNFAGINIGRCAPCSPENCTGCCEGSSCRDGDETSACGKGGASCTKCSGSLTCKSNVCS